MSNILFIFSSPLISCFIIFSLHKFRIYYLGFKFNDRSLRFSVQMKEYAFPLLMVMTNRIQFFEISHLQELRRNVLVHLTALPTAGQCELVMDALKARQLVEVVRIVAFDVFLENFDAIASSHHKTRNEESMSVESRHQRIERKMNLFGNGKWQMKFFVHFKIWENGSLTYKTASLLDIVHPTTRHETWSFSDKSIDIALTPLPMMDRDISDITNVTKRGERRM
jgi:hypothetical protein